MLNSQLASVCEELSAELEAARTAATTAAAQCAELTATARRLEAEEAELAGGSATRIKAAQAKLKAAKVGENCTHDGRKGQFPQVQFS